jgi:hypothetical protein
LWFCFSFLASGIVHDIVCLGKFSNLLLQACALGNFMGLCQSSMDVLLALTFFNLSGLILRQDFLQEQMTVHLLIFTWECSAGSQKIHFACIFFLFRWFISVLNFLSFYSCTAGKGLFPSLMLGLDFTVPCFSQFWDQWAPLAVSRSSKPLDNGCWLKTHINQYVCMIQITISFSYN